MRNSFVCLIGSLCLGLSSTALAQGRAVQYLNFEAPAHKPIAVTDVGGSNYLLVANAPDNSVEVYDTNGDNFLFRVPTPSPAPPPPPRCGSG